MVGEGRKKFIDTLYDGVLIGITTVVISSLTTNALGE